MAFYGIGNNQNGSFGYGGFGFSRGFYGNSFDRIQQDRERAAAETVSPNPDERTITPGHKPSCECSTCKSRKYKDGSDESDVSFQTAQHIDPGSAGSRVRAHEGEHVANAYEKAAEKGGKVLQASVAIKTDICPECGRVYVSGGTTTTKIAYPNEENPYQKQRKAEDHEKVAGKNVDLSA